ncbi:C80 family cysteine peptidase [Bordetella avium]|uniref:C80 family cysteine peptidase n=2 Tax=Bordetella avium TaxID=521 RepID=UPI0028704987|nr:C80 family cysteine peptidase [Bordetella avium]
MQTVAGDLRLLSQTTLRNSGRIRSQGELRAHSLGALLNTGQIVGGQLLAVQANHLDNSGALQAQDLLAQTPGALANTGRIEAQRRLDIATGTYANTGVMAGQNTRLSTSQPLTLDARAAAPQAGSALRISSPAITVAAPLASPAALTLQATEGDLDNASAITAGQTLVLRAQGAIRNRMGALIWSAQDLGLASQDLLNARHGLIYAQGAMAIEARGQLINRLGRIESGAAMQIDTPDLQNLAEVSGDVRVDPSQGGRVRGARYSVGRFLRSAHLQIGDFSGGDIVSTLQAEQGVIHAGGAMAVNQGARHGQPNQVLNQGRLTAQGQQDIDAQVRNTSPFKPLSLIDYFQRIPVPYEIWDSAASLSPIVRKQSLYALLDHALTRHPKESDNWYKIWGLYDYKNAWLGTALALADMRQAPALSSALAQALGGDWRGLSEDERSQRWQALIQGERGGILPIYPAQTAVIGGNQGVTIQGGLQNGEAMPAHLEAGLDPALRAAMQTAKQGWKPLPATPATSLSPSPAPTQANTQHPQADPATPPEGANHATPSGTPSPALPAQEADDFADTLAQLLANNHLFGHAGPVGAVPTPYYETRVPFVDPSRFYGSAYFFERVGYRPQAPMYVAGDNYFDDRFIRRQAERLMGAQLSRMPHTNLARQLMDNAAQAQAALGLQVGVAPTAEQLARLQDDIVWYTWHEIDGQSVLMPQVYLGQGTRAQPAVGAALASAGDIRVEGGAIQQNNAWIAGRTVRLQAGVNDVQIVNSDGVRGGVQADEAVDIAGRNLYIKGGVIQGKTVTLAAQHRLEIVTGRAADGQGQFRRDTHTGVFAGDSLSAQAGQDLLIRGAQLAGERVALQANNAYLGEVRQASGQREHHFNSDFLTLFFAESNARHTQNQGAGSTIQADTLDLNIGHDLGLLGGQIQARRTTGQIGGGMVAVASARHTRSTQQDIAFELMIGARAGAGSQEASATANQYSGHKSAAGQGAMSGAEARTGISFSYAHAHSQATTHHNAQLNLGAGRLEVGGRLDLGGADINADRAQDTAAHAGTLAISAQAIESTRYLDTASSQEESGGFFVGLKANARSSLLDVATHIGTTAQQGQQAEVDPGLTALQAVGDVSNLVLNDTGEVSASLGAELSYGRSDHHQQSENSHILGGNLHLTSTQGDIELVGARFAGGESVVLDAAHALHIRSAQSTESASSQSHSLSGYMNYSASCNAVQGACGASGNVSLGGSHTTSQLEARRYANSQIQAQHITLKSGGDTNLIGTRAQADQALTVQAGGSLRLDTLQDHQRSASNGGDWSLSAGAGVNTRTLGAVLFNAGITVHHEHDSYDTTTQAAGLHAGQRLTMRVGRDAALTGAAITAAGPGSSVDIGGKLIARTLQASRDHDGGYGGASAGISQSTSLPTLTLNAGRIAGEHYAATLNATVDIGQTRGNGTLQAAIEGPLMQQADRQEVVQHKRRWAQNDIQITFSKLDVGSKQAKQKMARGELDGPTAMDLKRNRVGPSSAELLPDKVAAHAPLQEAQATAKAPPDSSKIRSVSCDAGRCVPQELNALRAAPETLNLQVLGDRGLGAGQSDPQALATSAPDVGQKKSPSSGSRTSSTELAPSASIPDSRAPRERSPSLPLATGDRYQHRLIVPLSADATTQTAAARLAGKHAANSILLPADSQEAWRTAAQAMPRLDGRIKLQFVGHGSNDESTLGERNAATLAAMIQGLSPRLGVRLDKVALVGCDTGACSGRDIASPLRGLLRQQAPQAVVSAYEGRVDVSSLGKKLRVTEGGLGIGGSKPRHDSATATREESLEAPQSLIRYRITHPTSGYELLGNDKVEITQNGTADQLIILAHGSWTGLHLDSLRDYSGYTRIPQELAPVYFYSRHGETSYGAALQAILEAPDIALQGMPAITFSSRKQLRYNAQKNGFSFDDHKRFSAQKAQRVEVAPPGSWVPNYDLKVEDFGLLSDAHAGNLHPRFDVATATDRGGTTPFSDVLDMATATGSQYKAIHFLPCRICRDAQGRPIPARNDIIFVALDDARPESPPLVSPLPDPYGSRVVIQLDADLANEKAARRLTARHPENTAWLRLRPGDRVSLVSAGKQIQPGPQKIQLVGNASQHKGTPIIGGITAREAAQFIRTASTAVEPGAWLEKVSLVSCVTAACARNRLSDEVRRILKSRVEIQDFPSPPPSHGQDRPALSGAIPKHKTPQRSSQASGPSLAPGDRYQHRLIVPLATDPATQTAAARLAGKHAANSIVLAAATQEAWRTATATMPRLDGRIKLQFVGHGSHDEATLGGKNAATLAAMIQDLSPRLGADARLDKVALVGCDTGACAGRDIASQLRGVLRQQAPHAVVSAYDGKVDVSSLGKKTRVKEGGLGICCSKPRHNNAPASPGKNTKTPVIQFSTPHPTSGVTLMGNDKVEITQNGTADQLIVLAHGSWTPPHLDSPSDDIGYTRIPHGVAPIYFYSRHGEPTHGIALEQVMAAPDLALLGMPAIDFSSRKEIRHAAQAAGSAFHQYRQFLAKKTQRVEVAAAGTRVPDYDLEREDVDMLESAHAGMVNTRFDVITAAKPDNPSARFSDVLKMVKATGHPYKAIHFIACRTCLDSDGEPIAANDDIDSGLPSQPTNAIPSTVASSRDPYRSRIVLQLDNDPFNQEVARSLSTKHSTNSVWVSMDIGDSVYVHTIGKQIRPGPQKIQLVGHGSFYKGKPVIGGFTTKETAELIRQVNQTFTLGATLKKVTLVDCATTPCAGPKLRDDLAASLRALRLGRPQITIYTGKAAVTPTTSLSLGSQSGETAGQSPLKKRADKD